MDSITVSHAKSVLGYGAFSWLTFFLVTSVLCNFIFLYLLLRSKKTLELLQFSVGRLGLQLTYTINKDKQMLLLVEENIIIKKENEILKSDSTLTAWQKIALILGIVFLYLAFAWASITHFKSNDKKESNKDELDNNGSK